MAHAVDLRLLESLLNEVVEFVRSGRLLKPTDEVFSSTDTCLGTELTYEVRDVSEYIAGIRIDVAESDYLNLENDFLDKIGTAYEFVASYGPDEARNLVRGKIGLLSQAISNSPRVVTFAEYAAAADDQNVDVSTYVKHISTCLGRQCAAVMHARALTLSKRFAPLEVLFDALHSGLFPYGWSWERESILCVKPPVLP